MKILTDYLGRQVRLTEERSAHILEPPQMSGMKAAISEGSKFIVAVPIRHAITASTLCAYYKHVRSPLHEYIMYNG